MESIAIFEKELKEDRPDIKAIFIDPTLGINFKKNPEGWYVEESDIAWEYKRGDQQRDLQHPIPQDLVAFQKERITKANNPLGAIAALAPDLPIRKSSVDVVIDTHGPSRYLEDEQSAQKYFEQVRDILRDNGVGYFNFVNESRLQFIRSLGGLRVDIIETKYLSLQDAPGNYHKIKITKLPT